MYVPLNAISTNTMAPHITGNFCQNLAIALIHPETSKLMTNKGSLVNYVNETFFIQPKSSEIFLALQKCLFNGQAP